MNSTFDPLGIPSVSQLPGSSSAICQYKLSDFSLKDISTASLPDGTMIATNSAGQMSQIQYSTGISIRRYAEFVLVKTANCGYMFGSNNGCWFPID